jgi:hypothetical protein
MREYRAQLDAERANKLARGSNHADKREKLKKGILQPSVLEHLSQAFLCFIRATFLNDSGFLNGKRIHVSCLVCKRTVLSV